MAKTLKTMLHQYRFDIGKSSEREEYETLSARLHEEGYHFFNVLGDHKNRGKSPPDGEVELETDSLFSNQWNTSCGHRVFDWYEAIWINKAFKEGHWLEITPEMRLIREETLVCGYCGKYEPASSGKVFCDKCLKSEYLKETDLHLLRLKPVALFLPRRESLTEDELGVLKPLYITAQVTGKDSTLKRKISRQKKATQAAFEVAEVGYKGEMWLLEHGISLDNCIFYSHTRKFTFGWREPLSEEAAAQLKEAIAGFPYPCDGKTL